MNSQEALRPDAENEDRLENSLEIHKKVFGFDVCAQIVKSDESRGGKVDFESRSASFTVTYDDLKKGLEFIGDSLRRINQSKAGTDFIQKLRARLEKCGERKRGDKDLADQAVEDYAKSVGRTTKEVMEELLSELEREG